jgi:integrase
MPGVTEAYFRSPKLGEWTDDLAPGLILVVRPAKTGRLRKSWILRVVIDGKRRKIGLGSCGLAEARRRAAEARQDIREGNDPSARSRARQRAALRVSEAARCMTFGEAAAQWLPRAPKQRNPRSDEIRQRALEHHLAPIRDKALTAITPAEIVAILAALRPETAIRVYGAAKAVFEFGAALLESEGINLRPPTDLFKLRALGWSPRSRRSHKPMPALDWRRAPELLSELEQREEPIARLLAFILATASRCGAARAAERGSVDLKAKTWRIPAEDLKDAKFRSRALIVPLSAVALSAIPQGGGRFLFADERGKPFADQDIVNFVHKLRRRHPDWTDRATGRPFTAHGMRSMFRSWAAATRQDRELVELAMGHAVYGAVEGAYVRDPLDELRAELMERWARHCRGETAVVVPLRA